MDLKCSIDDCSASATDQWPSLHLVRKPRASDNEIVVRIGDERVKVKAKTLLEAVERLQ